MSADLCGGYSRTFVRLKAVFALESGKRSVQLDKVLAVLSALGLHLELHRGADSEIQ